MAEEELFQVDEYDDLGTEGTTDSRTGFVDWMERVPFGTQTAVLAGVLLTAAGVGELINTMGWPGSTCCTL